LNDLRVILLVLGAVAIVALYLWESLRERRAARRPAPRRDGPAIGPLAAPAPPEPEPSPPPAETPAQPRRIVALHVGAVDPSGFRGPEVLEALEAAGLRFGAMHIFHCFEAGAPGSDAPLFSVASMHEPGYLDPDTLDERFATRGLTLFMCVPAPVSSVLVFDLMVDTARALAAALNGRVLSPDRQEADEATLEAIRRTLT
jgi:cell division protein ZipA